MQRLLRVGAFVALSVAVVAQDREVSSSIGGSLGSPPTTIMPYADVQPLLAAFRQDFPPELTGTTPQERESFWGDWARAHDRDIRRRVARGDEDSLVNFWLFGTSFTSLPPARPREVALRGGGATLAEIVDRRLEDLVAALAFPGANDRLRWINTLLGASGIDPSTSGGRTRLREFLVHLRDRMFAENAGYQRALETAKTIADPVAGMTAYASLYSDRGLSSDTSILSSFAVEEMLEALKSSGMIEGPIRRAAVVGPGLDFINKKDGHDFYPEQTIQPFALVDSLLRLGLSKPGDLSVTTFDLSARVNQHLAGAKERARAGIGYVLQLPLANVERWSPALVRYWERAGRLIGDAAHAAPAPYAVGDVKTRAVRVHPDIVASITPYDLNIVLQRLEPIPDNELFDLVIATNVFAYYDRFEQALAVVNVGRMLRPRGSLLSNQAIVPVPPMKPDVGHDAIIYSDKQFDHFFWYQRQ